MTAPAASSGRPASLLLVTSNGTGMGHLSRMLSVARAVEGSASSVIMSMSLALPVVLDEGFPGEYCPSADRAWVTGPYWEHYLRDRVVALVRETGARVVAFDGVAPYRGLLLARRRLPDVAFVWVRRGMWRPGVNRAQLEKAPLFDLVIEPGDLAAAADAGLTRGRGDAVEVPPVSMLEVVDPLPRDDAAAGLGLDPRRPTVLVTLGSGRLGEVAAPGELALRALLEDPSWQIAVTRAAIAINEVPVVDRERIVELRGVYPLVRYLRAFDAAISAAGYNAVHELLLAGVPTLLVPNTATRTDDQAARAQQLADDGLALVAHPDRPEEIRGGALRLGDPAVREAIETKLRTVGLEPGAGGAHEIGRLLIELSMDSTPALADLGSRSAMAKAALKEGVRDLLGPRWSNVVRRALGRPVREVPEGTRRADLQHPPPLLDAGLAAALGAGEVVEHVLAGTSPGYRRARREIVARYWR